MTAQHGSYDTILVGTSFASSFFLHRYLRSAKPSERILVLERGGLNPHASQIDKRKSFAIDPKELVLNREGQKTWVVNVAFGGGSNCWAACTPRLLPNDFRLKSRYGVGRDWPLSYDRLEPYYCEAERIMSISGPDDASLFPRSEPYPQPPHRFSQVDKLFKREFPDQYFHQPTARARVQTTGRPACCGAGTCWLCPTNAKFTILNELQHLYDDPRVELRLDAEVTEVLSSGTTAKGVVFEEGGEAKRADANLVVLGASAIFNPFILLKSGISHPLVGRRLHEQVGILARIDLRGVNNFDGSTSITGNGYMRYDGEHRSRYAACLSESFNVPTIRLDLGKWQQRLVMNFIFEDLPSDENYVKVSERDARFPETHFSGISAYARAGIAALKAEVDEFLAFLPTERIDFMSDPSESEAHVLGTVVMGNESSQSVVDRHQIHHRLRNLLVLGGSSFPTSSPANPTLTIAALSLWSADHLF